MQTIITYSLAEIGKAAEDFLSQIGERKVFAFHGEMGAGKTTFIKALCLAMGVDENITSPTFALINEYETPTDKLIYHFDCYRLKDLREAYDIGAEEYFYSGNYCFIEWPEKIEDLLPLDTVEISIRVVEKNKRTIIING